VGQFTAPILLVVIALVSPRLQAARLYLVTPAAPAAGPLDDFLPRVLEAGVDVVQLREKDLEARPLLQAAGIVRRRTQEFGALFIVNDRVDLAIAAGADGVHLGQDDLPPGEARRQAGPGMLIGMSTHTPAEVTAAWGSGPALPHSDLADLDYIGVGPVHATPTKPGRPPVGLDLVRFAAHPPEPATPLPFFAIGGIDASTLPGVLAAGATRVCVLRALTESADPAASARRLRRMLGAAGAPAGAGSRA
jgi:thiamine-phosphate pyrophosphorylase